MRRGRFVAVIAVVTAVLIASLSVDFALRDGQQAPAAGSLTGWTSSSGYPMPVAGAGCATYSGFMYCVGGGSDSVYYADLSSPGTLAWESTTSYPVTPGYPSCVAYDGYLYCVSDSDVYYASINSSGVGEWYPGPSYPSSIQGDTCVAYTGYIYCVGGEEPNNPVNGSALDHVYYAKMNSSGIGPWAQTNSYPAADFGMSCVSALGSIYCIGGQDLTLATGDVLSSVYYARLNSSGVFGWEKSTDYPISVELESCAAYPSTDTMIYCISGQRRSSNSLSDAPDSYYAIVTPEGIGSWLKTDNFPASLQALSCASSQGGVYCVGGFEGATKSDVSSVYYSGIYGP